MLRVTIELVPHGDEQLKKKIGEMLIGNTGTGDYENGDYECLVAPDSWSGESEKYVEIKGHPRMANVWDLVLKVLKRKGKKPTKSKYYKLLKKRLTIVDHNTRLLDEWED